jgi:crotonobetainyl-CoA:carnitine CoA-transferase CaiB-like acyl-CoA transferase
VVDIMGGAFAVIAILAALRRRDRTGKGELVKSALFESTVFMMGQHMAGEAVTGEEVPPMPVRRGGWGIYQTFKTADDDQVFVGVTSNNHWTRFCEAFQRPDLFADPRLASNEDRVAARPWMLPIVAELLAHLTKAEIVERCERANIPYAPVARTSDLFDDPHLNASAGLVDVTLPGGIRTKLPRLPIEIAGERPGLYREAPRVGEHTREILADAGLGEAEIAALERQGIIAG